MTGEYFPGNESSSSSVKTFLTSMFLMFMQSYLMVTAVFNRYLQKISNKKKISGIQIETILKEKSIT
jgi:hypothetical protein